MQPQAALVPIFVGICMLLAGCGGGDSPSTPAPGSLPSWFTDAFHDVSAGLSVSLGASPKGKEYPTSVTILSKNLPLGLFLGQGAALKQGVVFKPGSLIPSCAFPVNAYTSKRRNIGPAAGSTLPRQCGVFNASIAGVVQEWRCQYTPQEYVAKFYDYPLLTAGSVTVWELSVGTCHFTDITTMLQAQQALLRRCITPPSNVSEAQWNTRLMGGPTFWNEVIAPPFTPKQVAGVFWVHAGSFRKPQKEHNDTQACIAAQNLKDAGSELPVFEFANFPFKFHFTVDELKIWSNILLAGGFKVADHFRNVDRAEFLEVLETDLCKTTNAMNVVGVDVMTV